MSGVEEAKEVEAVDEVEAAEIPTPRQEVATPEVVAADDVTAPSDDAADDEDAEYEDKPLDPAEFFALLKTSDEPSAPPASAPTPDPAPAAMSAPEMPFGAPPMMPPPMDPAAVQQPWGQPWGQWPQPLALVPPPVPEPRRVLKAFVRWTGALIAMCAVGAATAYVVSTPKRTDIPTLATKNDGRYVFPFYAKPPLPAGALGPGDAANKAENHFGDLRQYLLQPPTAAVGDKTYPGTTAWYPSADFCANVAEPDNVCGRLAELGLRHIAARGWTTPDGVHTTVWLLQFPDAGTANSGDALLLTYAPKAFDEQLGADFGPSAGVSVFDLRDTATPSKNVTVKSYGKVTKPGGSDVDSTLIGRYAHFALGDTVAVVATRGPKSVPEVPMDEVVTLQAELLR